MSIALSPKDEKARLDKLLSFEVLDTDFEKDYDEIVNLASYICETPIALISLIDNDRQWFKSKVGLNVRETPRNIAFCSHAIDMDEMLVINDTLNDNRFINNPLVTGDPNIRFYAGAQLVTKDGYALGTLCAIDRKPRDLSKNQLNALKILAKQIIAKFELQKSYIELHKYNEELNEQNIIKDKLFRIISHDLRSPFHSILGFSSLLSENTDELSPAEIKDISNHISQTAYNSFELVENLLDWSLHRSKFNEIKPVKVNLLEVFTKLSSVLSGIIRQKNINLNLEIDPKCSVFVEYSMLYSGMQNFITNAVKFSTVGGEIKISCALKDDKVEIEIKDFGIGLTKNEINELLSENGKASTNGTKGEVGKGLGFNIAKDFIQLCGGKIEIASEFGTGTSIKIFLPSN